MPQRSLWFDLPELLKVFQRVHQDKRVPQLFEELTASVPLVLDEAHRIAGKPKLQAFFQQVVEARAVHGAPTVLASRWHPKDVRDLDASLQSAWMAGFVAGIERPGPLGRLRYLRALEGSPSRNGRAPQIEALAQKTLGGYPELRAAWAQSRGATLPQRYLELIDPRTVFQRVRDQVAERFDVSASDLCGKSQSRALSRARKVLAKLCQAQGLKGSEIGNFLGRTRAAVSYMVLSLEKEMQKAPELRQLVEELQ
jgi:chromosomal replication initiation ATPase DnaA